MAANIPAKLDNWLVHNKNVIFIGKHGVGKTAMVKDAFERHKLKYRYFSASTMDPWVDFIGVPREKTSDKMPEQLLIIKELAAVEMALAVEWVKSNWHMQEASAKRIVEHAVARKEGPTYLDLVRPESFATGDVEALFFDEFNRSPKKVRNAVMELMQFKSINGYRFPNLRMIWAAINPDDDDDETYDVERLDPAQFDRFHVPVEVPYEPNLEWFRGRFGNRIADAAVGWWEELDDEKKNMVSPRRLQYALDVYKERGDMRDILPLECNIAKLNTALNTGPVTEKLEALMDSKNPAEARSYLSNENNYAAAMKYIPKSPTLISYFLPLMSKEKLGVIMAEDDKMARYIIDNSDKIPEFRSVCKSMMEANTNQALVRKIRKSLTDNDELAKAYHQPDGGRNAEPPHFVKAKAGVKWGAVLAELKVAPKTTPAERIGVYDKIVTTIPEKMTGGEALDCLEILNDLFGSNFSFSSSLTAKPFEKLMGVVNHSIGELNRNTGLGWEEMLKRHGSHFKGLLEKIKLSGLGPKLHTPKE